MEARPRCEIVFERSCNRSIHTQVVYQNSLKKFMNFCEVEKMSELLEADQKAIQEKVEDYVFYLTGKLNPNTIPTKLAPVFLFYDVNDVMLNKVKIKKMYPARVKKMGFSAYTREQIKEMLSNSKKKRSKALVLTFISSGMRLGGLVGLTMKDIIDIPNSECKCLTVYHDENEEYLTFLTPESVKALNEYFQERLNAGETFTDETPVFARNENQVRSHSKTKRQSIISNRMSVSAVSHSIQYMLASQERPKEKGGRYKTQITYGFRKYFNTVLKLNPTCNISIAEKIFGHSVSIKLDNHYLPLGMDELFKEFQKNIVELTIGEEERQLLRIKELEIEKANEKDKTHENKLLKEQLEILKLRMERMELSEKS
jgi:site-specific recombinase XerD